MKIKEFLKQKSRLLSILVSLTSVFYLPFVIYMVITGLKSWDVFPLLPVFMNFPLAGFCVTVVIFENGTVWNHKLPMQLQLPIKLKKVNNGELFVMLLINVCFLFFLELPALAVNLLD